MPSTSIVAYVPVIHAGYLEFFRKNSGNIFLIDPELVPEVEYLKRDFRALPVHLIARSLRAIWSEQDISDRPRSVMVVNNHILTDPRSAFGQEVVMPDEDVSRAFALEHLVSLNVTFDSPFLRWNWGNVQNAQEIKADRCIEVDEVLSKYFTSVYQLASKSPDWWRQVGALLIKDGEVLIGGYNTHMPHEMTNYILGDPRTPFAPGVRIDLSSAHHAEKQIIANAAKLGISTNEADLFVSTFPCPGCAMDIVVAGIRRVYFVEGYSLLSALEILRSGNIEIIQVVKPPQR